ncbi:MAG: Phenylacetic acid catabolic protein [Bacteriovorax sp.]|jgi:ring-1,2-phenylacetyl-CoA epoxidase subunit PaaA
MPTKNQTREYSNEELELFKEIKAGRTFESSEELPPFYRKHLLNLLWMQADSEYSGALGYMPWIAKAPTLAEKVLVAQMVKDEMRHASVIYRLLDELGQNTAEHVAKSELGYKLDEDQVNIGFKRIKPDYRVNIFYYDIKHWTDYILFNFLMDRAAGHQLLDTFNSSYMPWKKAIEGIYKEEVMHLAHGDKWVKILSRDPEQKKFLQERLNLWWPRVMNIFGSTVGASNDLYVNLGLKQRTNGEIRGVFVKEIQEMCKENGLTLPDYREEDQPQRETTAR